MRILIAAALLPALLLMIYIFTRDRIEKEPVPLLIRLALFGAAACIPSAIAESCLLALLESSSLVEPAFTFIRAFAIVAFWEELFKLIFLKSATWKNSAFDFRFDGIVYSVFVSLGFASLENILYLTGNGLGIALSRGLFAVPGHMTFSVFMGIHYSEAKQYDMLSRPFKKLLSMLTALLFPTLLHGLYDYLLMAGAEELAPFFFAFVALLDFYAFSRIRLCSRADAPFERNLSKSQRYF